MLDANLIFIVTGYLCIGVFAGMMSGLLGIGGGLVVVPLLAYFFRFQHFPGNILMHLAEGTSLAVMIFTTLRSMIAHLKYEGGFWPIYKELLPGLLVGSVTGAVVAHFLHSSVLSIIFGVFVLLIAIKMLLQRTVNPHHHLPGKVGMSIAGFVIGGKSGLLGIGGGAITIPFLTYCNVSMRKTVLVSIVAGFTVSIVGTLSFTLSGLGIPNLPAYTLGYIYWPAVIAVAAGSVIFAPIGAALSHRLPVSILKRIFALFMFVMGVHMLLYA